MENQGWETPQTETFYLLLTNNQDELKRWQDRAKTHKSIIEFSDRLQNHFTERFEAARIQNIDYLTTAILTQLLQDAFEKVDFMEIAKTMFAELGLEEF